MKTVRIIEAFIGYPDGARRRFAVGETPTLDPDYADMLIGKGLAVEIAPATAAPRAGKETKL